MEQTIEHTKHYLRVNEIETICLHKFSQQEFKHETPIFMLHGAMENSRIFHSKSKKGLAPFLAKKGYNVFAVDMRGKGESSPKVNKNSKQSQTDQILIDIPLCLTKIKELTQISNFHFVGHSWGGVLLLAYLARFPKTNVKSMVFFGSKRRVSVFSIRRILYIDLVWNLGGIVLGKLNGFVPFTKMKAGSDDEPYQFFREMNKWVYSKKWKDKKDDFNYLEAFKRVDLPPTLSMTGIKDHTLGNQKDVKLLMEEANLGKNSKFQLLSKENGNKTNYDHINILTHKEAVSDHFIDAYNWIKAND